MTAGSNGRNRIIIPYSATPLEGGLYYTGDVTQLMVSDLDSLPRSFLITNEFKFPIAITNISLQEGAATVFKVHTYLDINCIFISHKIS